MMRELSGPFPRRKDPGMDNLSTHFYNALPAPEARRIRRLHFTPKHATCLNMLEIRSASCAAKTAGSPVRHPGSAAWERQRNDSAARIKWMFYAG